MSRAPIPPLTALRAFEASARLGSHQAAAREIGRTPSAVTHQLRALEAHVGAPLFRRSGRSVVLTAEGAIYAEATSRALAELRQGEELIRRRGDARGIRVSVAPGFALLAAIPNIGDFHAAHPRLALSLSIDTRSVSVDGADADAAVRIGGGVWPGLDAELLFRIQLRPMAAPSLWERVGPTPGPRELASLPLIDSAGAPGQWDDWFAAHGQGQAAPPRRLSFDNVASAFQMAEQGAGVILGALPLGASILAAGRLQTRIAGATETAGGYYFVYPTQHRGDPRILAVSRWLADVVARLG